MGTIEINEKEIAYLRQATTNALVENCKIERGGVRFNSNPSNYNLLIENVEKKLNLKKVKVAFFKNLFSSKKKDLVVQVNKIDILYKYLFDEDRENHLKKHTPFQNKEYRTYHVDIEDKCRDYLKENYSSSIEEIQFEATNVIPALSRYSDGEIIIHINESILTSPNGVFLLAELFMNRFLFLIVDYNISFDIDPAIRGTENIKKNLLSIEGQAFYWDYWEERLKRFEGYDGGVFGRRFTQDKFVHMLEAIVGYGETKDERSLHKTSIDSYVPYMEKFTSGKVKPLSDIYRQQRDKELMGHRLNYLCVINYHSYFEAKERTEMVKYFYNFGKTLKDQNVFRIFTVPAQRVKNIGWKSLLSPSENQLLYQYLLLNAQMDGINTYIQYYDKSQISEKSAIIWNQDYVLRVDDKDLARLDSLEKLNAYYRVHDPRFSQDDKSQLFFAFPENAANENEVLSIHNELYMRRIHDDFIARSSYLNKDSSLSRVDHIEIVSADNTEFSNQECQQFDLNDAVKRSLGLSQLSAKQVHELRAFVFEHIEIGQKVDKLIEKASPK